MTIERVHVIFKTHLDIGFTNLASHVEKQYLEEFIPQAIALAERLEAEGGRERFLWTTGSWLIRRYLEQAGDAERERMERAIAKGHIAWHGLPFTTHTELMDAPLMRYGLSIAGELDRTYGRRTIAAKMTDVPGHTAAMIPLMAEAGLTYLHIGVNPASTVPDVPRLFRWRSSCGAELLVNYAGTYGEALEIDGLKDVLVFAHTGDNCGPPSAEEIREQFREIGSRYPGAEVRASTLDAFAAKLEAVRHTLPVVDEELGDTWIHGAGTDPLKLAKLRELGRLRDGWLADGRLTAAGPDYARISEAMLLTAEHTWGLDVKKWLPDFRHYAKSDFQAARAKDEVDPHDVPAKYGYIGAFAMDEFDRQSGALFGAETAKRSYSRLESSWAEQRRYVDQAVDGLAPDLRDEARRAFAALSPAAGGERAAGEARRAGERYEAAGREIVFSEQGALVGLTDRSGKAWVDERQPFGAYVYELFGTENYDHYFRTYMSNLAVTHPWADADFGKPGFENALPRPRHRLFAPTLDDLRFTGGAAGVSFRLRLRMPAEAHEQYGAPRELEAVYTFGHADDTVAIDLQWFGKEASRLPEASWFGCGLNVDNPNLWTMDKMGSAISPLRVVRDGNRNLHAVGQGVHYRGAEGLAVIESLDAALAAPGERRLLRFDNSFASLAGGWHFNLHNNIWGTNFPMWYGEDARFRFRLRLASNRPLRKR